MFSLAILIRLLFFNTSDQRLRHILWQWCEIALFFLQWFCPGTPSGTVQLLCEWVISCPWMNERRGPNSITSGEEEEETKRNRTIICRRDNKRFLPVTLPSDAPPCSTPSHFKIISYLRGQRAGSPTVKAFYMQRRPRRRLNPPYLLRLAIKSDYNIYISGAATIIKLVCNAAPVIKVRIWLKVTHNE